jgi:SKIP/SNW domain
VDEAVCQFAVRKWTIRKSVTRVGSWTERLDALAKFKLAGQTRMYKLPLRGPEQPLKRSPMGRLKPHSPRTCPIVRGKTSFIRYTPGQQSGGALQQRIIKMTEVVEDPLEPPRFKHKKIPRGLPSPPPPVLRSPPRKATAQEQKEWMIPPSISNWKNNKGFTIPLDKRLASDGRGLQWCSARNCKSR